MLSREKLTIGDQDVALNGDRLANHFVVRGVDFPALPEIILNEIVVDGRPGSWFSGRQIGTREITIRIGLFSATRSRVEAMEGWLHNAYILTLDKEAKLDLGHGHYVKAVMSGSTPVTKNGYWSTTDVTFKCFDPFVYGETYTIPLVSGSNKINIMGNYKASPVIELTKHSDNFVLTDEVSGKKVKVDKTGTTVPLVIDMEKYRCTQGGVYKAADPTVTTFWQFSPGENKINLQTGSGTLTYTEVYL